MKNYDYFVTLESQWRGKQKSVYYRGYIITGR